VAKGKCLIERGESGPLRLERKKEEGAEAEAEDVHRMTNQAVNDQ